MSCGRIAGSTSRCGRCATAFPGNGACAITELTPMELAWQRSSRSNRARVATARAVGELAHITGPSHANDPRHADAVGYGVLHGDRGADAGDHLVGGATHEIHAGVL